MKHIIDLLEKKKSLSFGQSKELLTQILKGYYEDNDIYEFLCAYEKKPYNAQEVLGFLAAMKDSSVQFEPNINEPIIDLCGTGGASKARFNISTCVAFVLAACGKYVAKHGNYGSKKPNGSFDFLEEIQVPFEFKPEGLTRLLKESYCCFLFARKFHPLMKNVANARRKVNKKTIFNFLGPLANPAKIDYQLIGLPSEKHVDMYIETIQQLDRKHVLLCIGGDNLDEVSLHGETKLISITKDKVTPFTFNFSKEIDAEKLSYTCGNSAKNASVFIDIFINEKWDHPVVKHIAVNAGAALYCLGDVTSIAEGYKKAINKFETLAVTRAITKYKSVASDIELGR